MSGLLPKPTLREQKSRQIRLFAEAVATYFRGCESLRPEERLLVLLDKLKFAALLGGAWAAGEVQVAPGVNEAPPSLTAAGARAVESVNDATAAVLEACDGLWRDFGEGCECDTSGEDDDTDEPEWEDEEDEDDEPESREPEGGLGSPEARRQYPWEPELAVRPVPAPHSPSQARAAFFAGLAAVQAEAEEAPADTEKAGQEGQGLCELPAGKSRSKRRKNRKAARERGEEEDEGAK